MKRETRQTVKKRLEVRLREFKKIYENIYKCKKEIRKNYKNIPCDCRSESSQTRSRRLQRRAIGQTTCGEDCINRIQKIECGSNCPSGNECLNQQIQKKNYSDVEVFETERKGLGLRARKAIFEGDFIMEFVGEVLDKSEFDKRYSQCSEEPNFYFLKLNNRNYIDATKTGNYSRFINHSCDPNAIFQAWIVNGLERIGVFATRKITCGEEITCDYQCDDISDEQRQECQCESTNCRGFL
ncbi:Histone-lysine N-methyltransferase Set1-like [Sergentomyia squamirostris]